MKKKSFLGLAFAALVMTSCAESDIAERIEQSKLNFRLSAGKTTKALTETDLSALQTAGTLNLFAFDASLSPINLPTFTTNQIDLTWDAPNWNPNKTIYLPSESSSAYPINFFSVYPLTNVKISNGSAPYDGQTTFFRYNIMNDNCEVDLMVGSGNVQGNTATEATIDYTHALSQIVISAKYINQIANSTAQITTCDVSNIGVDGVYEFGNDWTLLDGKGDVPYSTSTALPVDQSLEELGRFMFIPQEFNNNLSVSWTITDKATGDVIKEVSAAVPIINFTMEKSKRYYIDLIIDGTHSFTFNVTNSETWSDDDAHKEVEPK